MTPAELLAAWNQNRSDLAQAEGNLETQRQAVDQLAADERPQSLSAAAAAAALQTTRQTLAEVTAFLAERARLETDVAVAIERLNAIHEQLAARQQLSAMASGGAVDLALLGRFIDGLAALGWPPLAAPIQQLGMIRNLLASGNPVRIASGRAQLLGALASTQSALDPFLGQTQAALGANSAALGQVIAELALRPDRATLEAQQATQDPIARALSETLATTQAALASARIALVHLTAAVHRLRLAVPLTSGLVAALDPARPIALLPVRLETRFFERDPPSPGAVELRVRIYPDDIHQDGLQRGLRQREIDRGQAYWNEVWAAGTADPGRARREKAWSDFIREVGPERAAWIARSLRPTNDRGDPAPVFPAVSARAAAAQGPAHAASLPDRWVILGYRESRRVFAAWGRPVAGPLATTPAAPQSDPVAPGVWADDATRWMVDFDTAEAVGMGVRVAVDRQIAVAGLEVVLAVGVTATMDAEKDGASLEALLESHRYTDGLGFARQGVPTNHTDADRVPPASPRGLLGAFREEHAAPTLAPAQALDTSAPATFANGSVMARALGLLPAAGAGSVFEGVVDAELPEALWAHDMNLLAWPATWGYFLDQMMGDVLIPMVGETLGVEDPAPAIAAWRPFLDRQRDFFASHVRARGPLPALRVGRQPYGVLPATSLDLWRPEGAAGTGVWLFEQHGGDLFVRKSLALPAAGGDLAWSRDDAQASGHAPPASRVTVTELEGDGRVHVVAASANPLRLGVTPTRDPATGILEDGGLEAPLPFAGDRVDGLACLDLDADGAGADVLLAYHPPGPPEISVLVVGRGLGRDAQAGNWSAPLALPSPPAGAVVLGAAVAAADLDGAHRRLFPELPGVLDPRPQPRPRPPVLVPTLSIDMTFDARPHVVWVRALAIGARRVLEISTGPVLDPSGLVGSWATRAIDLDGFAGFLATAPALDVAVALVPHDASADLVVALSDGVLTGLFKLGNLRPTATFDGAPIPLVIFGATPGARLAGLVLGESARRRGPSLGATAADFGNLLEDLRAVWRQRAHAVPSLERGAREEDVDRAFLETVAMEGVSTGVLGRPAVGPHAWNQIRWANSGFSPAHPPAPDPWQQERDRLQQVLATSFRVPLRPLPHLGPLRFDWYRACGLGFLDPRPLAFPAAERTRLITGWLRANPPSSIHAARPGVKGAPADSLLYQVLRHATLWAYADTAYVLEPPPQPAQMPLAFTRDPELIDFFGAPDGPDRHSGAGTGTPTPWRYLEARQPDGKSRGDHLFNDAAGLTGYLALPTFLGALERLGDAEPDDPELLLAETLDLASHRLDAWVTALAAQRLDELRRARPTGIHLGGYGWVVNLRMRTDQPISTGFLHAPSTAHAATAAVLRSGSLARGGGLMSFDLTSGRVRLALELLDGVRRGQPLGALLGYRFERGLRDAGLAALTPRFRGIAPLAAGKLTQRVPAEEPVESIAANNVADGSRLLELGADLWNEPNLPAPGSPERAAVQGLLDALAGAAGAVRDLTLAEGVFQMVRGRPERAAAVLDATTRGEAMPEIEFAETPRTGTTLTHRVLSILTPGRSPSLPSGWAAQRPRALAEPTLDSWLGRLWGDPARYTCTVSYPRAVGSAELRTRTLSLADLGLCPLDLLALPPPASGTAGQGELGERVRRAAKALVPGFVDLATDLQVSFARAGAGLGFADLLTLVAAFRGLFGSVRALAPGDLVRGQAAAVAFVPDELEAREAAARAALDAATQVLGSTASSDDALRAALEVAAGFGIPGALTAAVSDRAAVATEAAQRLTRLRPADPAPADADERVARASENLRILFGNAFPILPRLAVTSDHAATLLAAQAARQAAGDAPPPVVTAWLRRAARVREAVGRFETASLCASAVAPGGLALLAGQIAQLPAPAPGKIDGWVAVATRDPRADWPSNPISIFACGDLGELAGASPLVAGLMVDEWTELVPNRTETTSWVFHFDAPGATAPQAVLVAVPPAPGRRWDLRTLEAILLGTIDLARIRLVDLEALAGHDLARFLPAIYLAANPADETIAAHVDG
ncbi:hypothetical protein WME75_21660 [Sorangium sp. So ce1014]|uniref:hypothetical protein n=1 Tax=Sorangium sp. So ce1014 TaxID=3133326 RepID=UPI003F6001B0